MKQRTPTARQNERDKTDNRGENQSADNFISNWMLVCHVVWASPGLMDTLGSVLGTDPFTDDVHQRGENQT